MKQFSCRRHVYPLFRHPLFLAGLGIKLLMLSMVLPQAAAQWYLPFLTATTNHLSLDPWQVFLQSGGDVASFPYGLVQWLAFLPLTLLCKFAGADHYWGYGGTLLLADIALLWILYELGAARGKLLLITYWFSPIVWFGTYWLGLNDLIPVCLLGLAMIHVRHLKLRFAAVFCAAAISAKLSMVLVLPFFVIYLFNLRAQRPYLSKFILTFLLCMLVFSLPQLASADGMNMLLNNPEMGKVYQFAMHIGKNPPIYLMPMTYLLMLYLAWRIRRINFSAFSALLGLTFFLVVLLTPASPGWFIWVMPLLVLYQATSKRLAILLVALFSLLFTLIHLLAMPAPLIMGSDMMLRLFASIESHLGEHISGLMQTSLLTFGVILMLRIAREMIFTSDFYQFTRKPLMIGIAGDSGCGKDTLVDSLRGLFGSHSTAKISGDDYHLWDRQEPMWQVMTHLNPHANNLQQFTQDLISLSNGKSIFSRHYDHASGKMSKPERIDSNAFIIASGLHALTSPEDCQRYDLSIFLDMNEDLRRHFKLQRDVHVRGHSAEKVMSSILSRLADTEKFVHPQASQADLVLSLQPIHPHSLQTWTGNATPRCKLSVRSRHQFNERALVRVLIGLCGLHVDMQRDSDGVTLTIEGDIGADDIALAARDLLPNLREMLDDRPVWEDGIKGLMQLIVLAHINQALHKRLS
jgi:uridine kinase